MTSSEGRFEVIFANGTGDYLVHVAAPTFASARRRLTGPQHLFIADIQMALEDGLLPGIVVYAATARPDRGAAEGVEVGSAESYADGVRGALPALERGNISATASLTPGIVATAGGVSALGLPASQSLVTLDGLAFAGTTVPRDAAVRTRVTTSTYDPSRGGFSSAEIALELAPGGTFSTRAGHATWQPFALQLSSAVVPALGARNTAADLGVGGDGEILGGRLNYSVSGQLTRRAMPVPTLEQGQVDPIQAFGLVPDSVRALLNTSRMLGIPLSLGETVSSQTTTRGTLLMRLDHKPAAARTWGVGAYVDVARDDPLAFSPLASQSHAAVGRSSVASATGTYSFYTKANRLNETRVGVSQTSEQVRPLVQYPDITVGLSTPASAAGDGSTPVLIGADNTVARRLSLWTIQATNQTLANIVGSSHRLKLAVEARADVYRLRDDANKNGSIVFAGPTSLITGSPTLFTRALDTPVISGGIATAALSLGDLWQTRPTLQLLYGVRLEGERFTSHAPLNAMVLDDLQFRTDAAPGSVAVLPRLGFTWFYGGGDNTGGQLKNAIGSFSPSGTAGTLRGGIGLFRARNSSSLLAEAQRNAGTDGALGVVTCGPFNAPHIDWGTLAVDPTALPSQCTETGPSAGSIIPDLRVLDPAFRPARSWRSNVAWTSAAYKWIATIEAIYSLNLDQPFHQDVNFTAVPVFFLPDEGQRPVYSAVSAIDPTTGGMTVSASRRSSRLRTVVDLAAGARSVSKQLVLSIAPQPNLSDTRYYRLSYVLARSTAQLTGIDGTTDDGRQGLAWMRSPNDVTHQFLIQGGLTIPHVGVATVFGRLASGRPYTPVVDADINGDGFANDRATVGVGTQRDPALDDAFARFLTDAPGNVRECLRPLIGAIAPPNRCRTGWTQTVNAQFTLANDLLHVTRRANVSVQVNNVLSGIGRVLRGKGGGAAWGAPMDPDPVLYHVKGFDPVTQRFAYDLNPNFGRPRGTTALLGAPFRVTLDVSVDLGVPQRVQLLKRALGAGRRGNGSPRLSAKDLRARYARSIPDVYAIILFNSDSLLISAQQEQALRAARESYKAATDSIWAELGDHLASLGDEYDVRRALAEADSATSRVWQIVQLQRPLIEAVLSPVQLSLLPQLVRAILTSPTPIRISTGG